MKKLIKTCSLVALLGFGLTIAQADPIVLSYHTSTIAGSTTFIYSAASPPAVKYDLPDSTKQYEVISLGIWSQGRPGNSVFPANTKIVVRIWDASGLPLYTSDVFDWSGESCALALRTMYIDTVHVQVYGSFYAGFQLALGFAQGEFGYKVDVPWGNQYGHSYEYEVSDGTWSAGTEDLMFDATVDVVIQGDLDYDGVVDLADLALFSPHWLRDDCVAPDWCDGADINKDGPVDFADLAILANHWLEGVNP
jgi:hypothetical protein